MATSKYLSYPEFLAFFTRNGFAVWSSLVRQASELPPQSNYDTWLASVQATEAHEEVEINYP